MAGKAYLVDGSGNAIGVTGNPLKVSGAAGSTNHFVTTTADSGLTNSTNLGALTTGILKHTVSAGASTIATATAGSDYLAGFTNSRIQVDTGNGTGAVNTKIRIFSNATVSTGSDITRATSANNGDSFTIVTAGVYAITYSDFSTAASCTIGLSVNSNELTTGILTITATNILSHASTAGANQTICVSYVGAFSANDVIRAHQGGTAANGTSAACRLNIERVR